MAIDNSVLPRDSNNGYITIDGVRRSTFLGVWPKNDLGFESAAVFYTDTGEFCAEQTAQYFYGSYNVSKDPTLIERVRLDYEKALNQKQEEEADPSDSMAQMLDFVRAQGLPDEMMRIFEDMSQEWPEDAELLGGVGLHVPSTDNVLLALGGVDSEGNIVILSNVRELPPDVIEQIKERVVAHLQNDFFDERFWKVVWSAE